MVDAVPSVDHGGVPPALNMLHVGRRERHALGQPDDGPEPVVEVSRGGEAHDLDPVCRQGTLQ